MIAVSSNSVHPSFRNTQAQKVDGSKSFSQIKISDEISDDDDEKYQVVGPNGYNIDLYTDIIKEEIDDESYGDVYNYANPIKIEEEVERKITSKHDTSKQRVKYNDPNKSIKPSKCKTCKALKLPKNKVCKVKQICRLCTQNTCQKHIVIVCQSCSKQADNSELVLLKDIEAKRGRCKVCVSEIPLGFRKVLGQQLGRLGSQCQSCTINVCTKHFFSICVRCSKTVEKKEASLNNLENKAEQESTSVAIEN